MWVTGIYHIAGCIYFWLLSSALNESISNKNPNLFPCTVKLLFTMQKHSKIASKKALWICHHSLSDGTGKNTSWSRWLQPGEGLSKLCGPLASWMFAPHTAPQSLITSLCTLTHSPVQICCGPGLHFCQISQSRGRSVCAGCVLAAGSGPAMGRQGRAGAGTGSRQPQHTVSDLAWGLLRRIHPDRNFWAYLTVQNEFVWVEVPAVVLVSPEGPGSWVCRGGAGLPMVRKAGLQCWGRHTNLSLDTKVMPTARDLSPFQLFLLPFLLCRAKLLI